MPKKAKIDDNLDVVLISVTKQFLSMMKDTEDISKLN